MPEVVVDGLRLAYAETGAGAPVLAVHSGGLSGRQWKRLGERLGPDFRLIAPDLLGYGGSTPWPLEAPFHFRQDVAALDALLDRIGEPVHLVGHSYGGFLALKLALARPASVRRMVLFEPVAFGVLDALEDAEALALLARVGLDYEPHGPDGADDAWLAQFVEWWNGPGAWSAFGDDVKATFRRAGWKLFQEVLSLSADRTPRAAYASVTAPTLLLGAERSPMTERRVLEHLAAALPHARIEIFPDVGHMAPVTHAARVNEAIALHLSSDEISVKTRA
jgi:pimeloyl-ACP methyl ester carboxylesterase